MSNSLPTLADYAALPPTVRAAFVRLSETPAGRLRHQRAAMVVGGLDVLPDFGYDKVVVSGFARIALVTAGVNTAMAAGAMDVIKVWVADYAAGVGDDGAGVGDDVAGVGDDVAGVGDDVAEVSENFGGGDENAPGAAKIHPSMAGIERNKASAPAVVPDFDLEPIYSPQDAKLLSNAALAAERWNERTKGR